MNYTMQDFQQCFVGGLCLAIPLRVVNKGPALFDSKLFAQLPSIVHNNRGWVTILANDVIQYKQGNMFAYSSR